MTQATRWLVRTARREILGPYSEDAVRKEILTGRLSYSDEICPANGQWISIHQTQEVKRLLEIDVPRSAFAAAEDEETETETRLSPPSTVPSSLKPPPAPWPKLTVKEPRVSFWILLVWAFVIIGCLALFTLFRWLKP